MITTKKRRGTSLLEFALVIPFLLLVLLGIIEFAWFARTQLAVANAVREGARVASIGKTQGEIRNRVVNAAIPLTVDPANIALEQSTDSGASYGAFPADNTAKTPPQNGVTTGALVRVRIDMPHRRIVNLPVTPSRIRVQVSMVRERT